MLCSSGFTWKRSGELLTAFPRAITSRRPTNWHGACFVLSQATGKRVCNCLCAKACFSAQLEVSEWLRDVRHIWKHLVPRAWLFCAGAQGSTHDLCAYKAHALPTELGGFNFCSKPSESWRMASSMRGNMSYSHRFHVYLAGFGLDFSKKRLLVACLSDSIEQTGFVLLCVRLVFSPQASYNLQVGSSWLFAVLHQVLIPYIEMTSLVIMDLPDYCQVVSICCWNSWMLMCPGLVCFFQSSTVSFPGCTLFLCLYRPHGAYSMPTIKAHVLRVSS